MALAALALGSTGESAVIRVKSSATGTGDGSTWHDAHRELVTAIAAAQPGDEIWVASGIYYPDFDIASGQHTGNRVLRFELKSDVKLFGGFSGVESHREERDWSANRTILSGDIGARGNLSDNTQTIMHAGTDSQGWPRTGIVVEGFVFSGGNANGNSSTGMPGEFGGAVNVFNAQAEFRHCIFVDNHATYGGAVQIGSAFHLPRENHVSLINCLFAHNSSKYSGGAVSFSPREGKFIVANCTVINNRGSTGAGMAVSRDADSTLVNNIVHSNTSSAFYTDAVITGVGPFKKNILEHAANVAGENNLIVASVHFSVTPNSGSDGRWGTMDDVLMATLSEQSPAVGFADRSLLPPDSTDQNGNLNATESLAFDLQRMERTRGAMPDAGAFEFQGNTNLPPRLHTPLPGSFSSSPLTISYTLYEDAEPGSVALQFQDSRATIFLRVSQNQESPGSHTLTLDLSDPTSSAGIIEGSKIPDGTYTVRLSQRLTSGVPSQGADIDSVSIDTAAPLLNLGQTLDVYTEGDGGRIIAPHASISDASGFWTKSRLIVDLDNAKDDAMLFRSQTGLTLKDGVISESGVSFATIVPPNGKAVFGQKFTITFDTAATDERVQKVIRAIEFSNPLETPPTDLRVVTFTVADAAGGTATASCEFNTLIVDDVPVVTPSVFETTYIEGWDGAANPVFIDSGLTVKDDDTPSLKSATIEIIGNFHSGADVLHWSRNAATMGDITGSETSNSGRIDLTSPSGGATILQWQSALRAVKFSNTSNNPLVAPREIEFTVRDRQQSMTTARKSVAIFPWNDAPLAFDQETSTLEGTAMLIALVGSDPEDAPLSAMIVRGPLRGTLTGTGLDWVYTPAPDFSGEDFFTFRLQDATTSSTSARVVISVRPVNDPPRFEAPPAVAVAQDAGPQVLEQWATALRAGPADEASQSLSFHVHVDRPELFTVLPQISPAGDLTFTPAADQSGIATVYITLQDNGGTDNGGIDVSSPHVAQIAVTTYVEEFGSYSGLLQPPPSTPRSHDRTGTIRVAVQSSGRFTGALQMGGKRTSIKGMFDKSGVAHFSRTGTSSFPVVLGGDERVFQLQLHLDVAFHSGQMTGSLTENSATFAEIQAYRELYSSKKNPESPYRAVPGELLGRYTVLLPPADQDHETAGTPLGSGVATLVVHPNGIARLVGRLADGSAISSAAPIAQGGGWPIYSLFAKGAGSLSGWARFEDIPETSDIAAPELHWFKPPDEKSALFPEGWMNGHSISLVGSKLVLQDGAPILPGLDETGADNVMISVMGGDLPEDGFIQPAHWSSKKKLTISEPNDQRMSVSVTKAGLLKGQFSHPSRRGPHKILGAILQKQRLVGGFFSGKEKAGDFTIEPIGDTSLQDK